MMRIILVEDEPSAMRYLRSIIELKCSGFEVVDTAENGAEALEKIRAVKPDVVITDIKMGIMDGIELVTQIKEEFSFIYSVIVSGYQDFEYAKGAMKCGVVDYLLKPVNANQLKNLLDTLKEKLERQYNEKRVALLKRTLTGAIVEAWQIERYLPFKEYSAVILRKNGLPSRFSSKHGFVYDSLALETKAILDRKENNNVWIVPGRDEQEVIFFHTEEISGENCFEKFVEEVAETLRDGYHTLVFSIKKFSLMNFTKVVSEMYRRLDNSIVIGLSQKIYKLQEVKTKTEKRTLLDGTLGNKIGFLLSNAMYGKLKEEFIVLFTAWEKEKRTQLWVENSLRQILTYVEKHSVASRQEENYDIEFLLDEALYYSTTFGELMTNVWDIVERITGFVEKKKHKVDTSEFFKSIQQYMEQNISEPLSLQSVCAVFKISQTYLSRLFRKYQKMSFNEYLTTIRIDKAKQIIEENANIPLKEVALFVGYNDPFYFSRVFRSVTGMPPSEYITGNRH